MIAKIKSFIAKHPTFMNIAAFGYNFLHYNNSWQYRLGTNTILLKGVFLKKTRFNIKGKNNTVIIGPKARLRNCSFFIEGNNCKVVIGGGSTVIFDAEFYIQEDNSSIIIGSDFYLGAGHIAATEGESITIGNDCMFGDVVIRNGDSHAIIDTLLQKRINHAQPVKIGNHVWITAHVRILKGAHIPSNVIIGNSCIITSKLEKENAIYAGIPAKIVKEHIQWVKER